MAGDEQKKIKIQKLCSDLVLNILKFNFKLARDEEKKIKKIKIEKMCLD